MGPSRGGLPAASEALEKTPPDAVGRGTAALLERHGKNLVFGGRNDEAATVIDRAIGMASALGDNKLLTNALDAEATRLWFSGRTVLARLVARGAVDASRTSGLLDDLVKHLSNRATLCSALISRQSMCSERPSKVGADWATQ